MSEIHDTPPRRSTSPGRILGIAEVRHETSLGRSTIWRRIKEGSFPAPIPLGGHRKGWSEREIEEWKARRMEAAHKR
ncbi:MAG: AlpA family phage regulatory protein [Sphingopyxis granuli]